MPILTRSRELRRGNHPTNIIYQGSTKSWPITAFDPKTITGLKVWLDADGLPAGKLIGQWPDKSGFMNHGLVNTTSTPNMEPVVRAGALNGKSVVRFTINEGRIRGSSSVNLDYTFAYVGRLWDTTNAGRVVTTQYPPDNALWGFWNGFEDVFYSSGFYTPDTRISATTSWIMYTGDGTSSPMGSRAFRNGVKLADGSNGNAWGGHYHLSGYDAGHIQETCNCEIAEFLLWDHQLTDAERGQVEAYLRKKWALS